MKLRTELFGPMWMFRETKLEESPSAPLAFYGHTAQETDFPIWRTTDDFAPRDRNPLWRTTKDSPPGQCIPFGVLPTTLHPADHSQAASGDQLVPSHRPNRLFQAVSRYQALIVFTKRFVARRKVFGRTPNGKVGILRNEPFRTPNGKVVAWRKVFGRTPNGKVDSMGRVAALPNTLGTEPYCELVDCGGRNFTCGWPQGCCNSAVPTFLCDNHCDSN